MASARLSWSPINGATAYQLTIYDRTDARTIVDEMVASAACTVTIPDEFSNHDLSMRVRALHGDGWGDWTAFQPLPLEFILGERREAAPPLLPEEDPRLLLIFTVDTECSVLRQPNPNPDRVVDELIFGDFGNGRRPGGICLQMDLLEHFGFRGSFFVDVLMEFEYGPAALERTVEAILQRGHEVELHVHPEHLRWSGNRQAARLAGELSNGRVLRDPDVFRRLMELSVDLFERRVGRPPLAYRAGAYRIADIQFPVLEEFGIRVDSSVQPYFNSQVSDWMRTRTQPFRVGGILEVPPTYLVLNERPGEWETRGFTPNSYLGDPISSLPVDEGSPPHVVTFVSHSFQLLRRNDSKDPKTVEAFLHRLRSSGPDELADQYMRESTRAVRTFGEEVDDGLVAAVAGILRRVADRPKARCVTYADLAAIADRFWPGQRYPPTDPVPMINRNQGVARVGGTRVFGRDLLLHLANRGPASSFPVVAEGSDWISGCENGDAMEFHERLGSCVDEIGGGERLRVRLRTLGVAPQQSRGALPPLAEILFPTTAIDTVADEIGAEPWQGLPWDGSTFKAWLAEKGFEVFTRTVLRRPEELAAIEQFAEKLKWLDRSELATDALDVELQRVPAGADSQPQSAPPFQLASEGFPSTMILPVRVDPASLPVAAASLYKSMQPGEEIRLKVVEEPSPASRTTCLLALMRAGLEIVGQDQSDYLLLRPLELYDIRRFAGVS